MLSEVICQGVQFLKKKVYDVLSIDIFVVALSEVLYMSHFLYLCTPPFDSDVHSHKNLLECLF